MHGHILSPPRRITGRFSPSPSLLTLTAIPSFRAVYVEFDKPNEQLKKEKGRSRSLTGLQVSENPDTGVHHRQHRVRPRQTLEERLFF